MYFHRNKLFLSLPFPGMFLCPISDTYLSFPRKWGLCVGWLDNQSHQNYRKITSTKQWYKKCQDLCHFHGDQWHIRMLHVSLGRLMSSLNVFIYRQEAAGFQPALCLLNSVRASLLNPIEKLVPPPGTANFMKLFCSVDKREFCNPKWEGPKLLLWREKRCGERHRKHAETRGKLGKGK